MYGLRYSWWVLIALAYIVSPIDLVPDALLPFGIVDDAGMAAFGVYNLVSWLRWRRARRAGAEAATPGVKRVQNTADATR
jgi:uncharacterized membrane protein YkvA (DUF1232 family)